MKQDILVFTALLGLATSVLAKTSKVAKKKKKK
jgi:hypothetical protein